MSNSKSPPKFIKAKNPVDVHPALDELDAADELAKFQLMSVLAQIELFLSFRGEAEPLFEVVGPIIEGKGLP